MRGTAHEQSWQLILDLFFRQRGRMLAIAQEFGLAPQQAIAIKLLDRERGTPMSELAKTLHCDNSNVTGIADRLEAHGLIERRACPTDRRVKTLVLTAKGAEIQAAYASRLGAVPPELAALSEADAASLLEIMRRATVPAATPASAAPVPRTSPTA
jgi:MarR family transcriptional regulator, organic hydroperoxide resistance regulator